MTKAKTPKPESTKTEAPTRTLDKIDVGRGNAKIKALREKFSRALDDPDMRAAMARYLQNLLRDETKS